MVLLRALAHLDLQQLTCLDDGHRIDGCILGPRDTHLFDGLHNVHTFAYPGERLVPDRMVREAGLGQAIHKDKDSKPKFRKHSRRRGHVIGTLQACELGVGGWGLCLVWWPPPS